MRDPRVPGVGWYTPEPVDTMFGRFQYACGSWFHDGHRPEKEKKTVGDIGRYCRSPLAELALCTRCGFPRQGRREAVCDGCYGKTLAASAEARPPASKGSDEFKVQQRRRELDEAERKLIRSYGESGWVSPHAVLSSDPDDEHARWAHWRNQYVETGNASALGTMLGFVDFDCPPERVPETPKPRPRPVPWLWWPVLALNGFSLGVNTAGREYPWALLSLAVVAAYIAMIARRRLARARCR